MWPRSFLDTLNVDVLCPCKDPRAAEEAPMATLMLTMDLDPSRADEVQRQVSMNVIPLVRRLPGFRSGRWVRSLDHSYCLVLVEFDTEAEAQDVAELASAQRNNPARSWNFDRVIVTEEIGLVGSPPDLSHLR
jgi:hypothetical protein